jgi:putative heme iron utilization protein
VADPTPNPFDDDVVEAIARHMNADHADDSRVIVQAFGHPAGEVTDVTMTGLDGDGIDFRAVLASGDAVDVRVPWSTRLTERAQVRVEVVRLYDEACAQLGLPGREAGEH